MFGKMADADEADASKKRATELRSNAAATGGALSVRLLASRCCASC